MANEGHPSWTLLANLDPPGSGAWQGASRNSVTGEWFVAHSRGSHIGGPAEDGTTTW